MRDTSLRARLACWLGWHSWKSLTCQDEHEARACRNCTTIQMRTVGFTGIPDGPWRSVEPEPREVSW